MRSRIPTFLRATCISRKAVTVAVLAMLLLSGIVSSRTVRAQVPAAPQMAQIPLQLTSGTQVDTYLTKAQFQGYVLLARHGRILLSKGYGMADATTKAPTTLQTRWPMFGVEGFMVAIAVLRLQEEGKLTVQDTLCTYVHGCPQAWRSLTIQEMLNGSSTIGIYNPFSVPGTIAATIALCKATPMLTAPQGVQSDSPCNRVLLSQVIAQVTHESFGTAMRQLVFGPAGMTNTGLVTGAPARSAHGYSAGMAAVPLEYGGYPLIYATAGNVQRLDGALLAGKLHSPQSVRALIAPQWKAAPTVPLWYADGSYVAKANLWFFASLNTSIPGRTHRVVAMSDGPDGAGFEIDNLFSPDDGTIEIELNNDTGLFSNDADNHFQDHVERLLWGA